MLKETWETAVRNTWPDAEFIFKKDLTHIQTPGSSLLLTHLKGIETMEEEDLMEHLAQLCHDNNSKTGQADMVKTC